MICITSEEQRKREKEERELQKKREREEKGKRICEWHLLFYLYCKISANFNIR